MQKCTEPLHNHHDGCPICDMLCPSCVEYNFPQTDEINPKYGVCLSCQELNLFES